MKNISAKKLKKLGGKMPFSSITSPKKTIPKSNPRQQAKRKAGYRKLLAGKEYRSARAEAFKRAGNRCEATFVVEDVRNNSPPTEVRCGNDEGLHAHHLRYPKSRSLEARDLLVVCKPHHEWLESLKMGKTRMF